MASLVGHAALILDWNQKVRDVDQGAWPTREEDEEDATRRMQRQSEYRTLPHSCAIPEEYREKYQRYSEEVDRVVDREKWGRGKLPLEFSSRAPFIHARASSTPSTALPRC